MQSRNEIALSIPQISKGFHSCRTARGDVSDLDPGDADLDHHGHSHGFVAGRADRNSSCRTSQDNVECHWTGSRVHGQPSGNNRNQWLLATTNPGNLGPASSPSPNASRLVFFTSAADRYDGNAGSRERQGGGNGGNRNADLGGDVSVVSYELDFVEPIFGSSNQLFSTFVLYRNLLEPNEAYPNAGLWSDNIAQGFDNASRPNDLADMVCENVYDFTATFVVNYRGVDGQLQTARLPVMSSAGGDRVLRSFAITGAGLEPNQRAGSEFAGGRIASVELSITVLSDEGISILKRTPFRSPAERAQFLEKHSYRYTRSVIIPQN